MVSLINVYDKKMDSFYDVDSVISWDDAYDFFPIKEMLSIEALVVVIITLGNDGINDYNKMVCVL